MVGKSLNTIIKLMVLIILATYTGLVPALHTNVTVDRFHVMSYILQMSTISFGQMHVLQAI